MPVRDRPYVDAHDLGYLRVDQSFPDAIPRRSDVPRPLDDGSPAEPAVPREIDRGLDRLFAIGRTAYEHDLDYPRLDQTFADTALAR